VTDMRRERPPLLQVLIWLMHVLSRLQTSKFSMTSFHVTSFICQVHVCICNKFYMTSFDITVLFTGVNVSTCLLWKFISGHAAMYNIVQRTTRGLANHIKCSDYFDKFSLLTHTDEQHLYFDNFFYDKCTCSKASML
jgi:hypothetical protein